MPLLRRWSSRLARPRIDDEVDDELSFHVEMRSRELEAEGMPPDEARAAAARRVDHLRATLRELGRERNDRMRRTRVFTDLGQDLRFAFRQLRRTPGFTAVAVLTLALGIGATTGIFSAVHAIVLRPLPFQNADRITAIYSTMRDQRSNVSAGNFVDGIAPVAAFQSVMAIQYSSFNVGDGADAERVIGARASAGFFDVFSMAPALGRVFSAADDQPGLEHVVVLGHRLWSRRFAADGSVVGTTIRLNGIPYQVIGVMPPAFEITSQTEQLWVPIAFTPQRRAEHDEHYLQVYGRLADGASLEQAGAELGASAERLRQKFPDDNLGRGFMVMTALEELAGDYRTRLFTLLGAVAFVLLIACGNVANLLLARGAVRESELAVRASLGAGRGRLFRQLLTESFVLASIAALAGIGLAALAIRALVSAAPAGIPRIEQTSLNPAVLAFAVAASAVCAIVFGLVPAFRLTAAGAQAALRDRSRGSGGRLRDRMRTGLIAGELAIALVLLVGAGLMIRSAIALQRVGTGFDPEAVFSARLSLPASTYADASTASQTFARIADAAAQVSGVAAAAITSQVPMGGGGNSNGLVPEGMDRSMSIDARLRIVTSGYFGVMRIPILRGRALDDRDRRGALKVMVISQSMAQRAFPDQDPIGKRIACCEAGPDGNSPDYKTVVGVAGDVRWRGPGEAPSPEFYLPMAQAPDAAWDWLQRTMYVVARPTRPSDAIGGPLRSAIAEIAPGVPLFNVMTMDQRIASSIATAKFNTLLLSILGGVGLALATIGIYGVIAYVVARRTQEIGVRMALGATRAGIISLMLRHAVLPVGAGVAAGLAAAALLARFLSTQLFGVSALDPITFAAVPVLLTAISAIACLIPASRAAGVDPTSALRAE